MSDRRNPIAWWLRILLFVLPVAGGTATYLLAAALKDQWFGTHMIWMALAAMAIALGGLFSVPTNTGNRFTPSYIVAAALPIIAEFNTRAIDAPSIPVFSRNESLVVIGTGLTVLWSIRTLRGDHPISVADRYVRRGAVFVTYVYVYDLMVSTRLLDGSDWRSLSFFVISLFAAFVVEIAIDVLVTGRFRGAKRHYAIAASVTDGSVFVALMAAGALFGIAYEAISAWAIAVAILPYSFTAAVFRRVADTRRTYEQTLVALAQIPEVGGHTALGHAKRTNELSVAVAEWIGVTPKQFEQINYASYLHDIGRITLNEPSILRQGFTDVDIARWGSEIVGQTPYLSAVAEAVQRQYEPFRSPGEVANPDIPLASRIIKACSAYDESVNELGFSALEAMERIHRGTVYDYDPEVVKALRSVLERKGAFHPVATPV